MPTGQVLLTVDRGQVAADLNGDDVTLEAGDRRFIKAGTQINVPMQSTGRLTFAGGAAALLCGGSSTRVRSLATGAGRHRDPEAILSLTGGRVLADTTSTSGAYRPLTLTVTRPRSDVASSGPAWYSVDPAAVTVSSGSWRSAEPRRRPAGPT